jgi:hypothetical protein
LAGEDQLPILYQKMADITSPLCASGQGECGQFCSRKSRCCERRYCLATAAFAKEKYGIDLVPTSNPDLPFMGERGCVVAPHLRPVCTLHVCTVSWADKSHIEHDEQKTADYYALRAEILAEAKRQNKGPF